MTTTNTPDGNELDRQFRNLLFTPMHIDHQNYEPDEMTIKKDGKEYYLSKLVEIAQSWHQKQLAAAVLEARIEEIENLLLKFVHILPNGVEAYVSSIEAEGAIRERLSQLRHQAESGEEE